MKVLVSGFSQEETLHLSALLREEGHQAFCALGRQATEMLLNSTQPALVLVPEGEEGQALGAWVQGLAPEIKVSPLRDGAALGEILARHAAGEVWPVFGAEVSAGEGEAVPPPVPRAVSGERAGAAGGGDGAAEPVVVGAEVVEAELVGWGDGVGAPAQGGGRGASGGGAGDAGGAPGGGGEAAVLLPEAPEAGLGGEGRVEGGGAWEAAEPKALHPELAAKLAQVRFGDYHSILEVEPGASPYAISDQIERLSSRFSPQGWQGRLEPAELAAIEEISNGIADAALILGDAELAMRYERALRAAQR